MRDLANVLVVSVEQAVAAPYASCKLADAGARVIKVERPGGDFARGYDRLAKGQSAYFVWLNRGKESVCLDLKSAPDLAVLKTMIARADIFLQNLAPGALDRLGIGVEALRQAHPRLVICSISGYAQDGPARDQKAYDLLIQAESGLSAINGTGHGPARVGVSVCDIAAGMAAYQAILEALIGRAATGEGRAIDVTLFDAISDWMNVPYLQYRYGGRAPAPMGLSHPTIAPYGAFHCADDKVILLSIQNEREWAALCTHILADPTLPERPGFRDNTARINNRERVDGLVAAALRRLPREDAAARLQAAGIAFGRLTDPDDLLNHPEHRLIAVRTEGGTVELLAPGASVRGQPRPAAAVPGLGADTERLKAEFSPQDHTGTMRR